jgi:HSP20 family protein
MRVNHPFFVDSFDFLWRDLLADQATFKDSTNKTPHPIDLYKVDDGIQLEVAAVGLDYEDIEILVEGEQLSISYKAKPDERTVMLKGIKKGSFSIVWKISNKLDLSKMSATLNRGLLTLHIPTAEGQLPRKIEIQNSDKPKLENKKK